jgi:toxin HigB-1
LHQARIDDASCGETTDQARDADLAKIRVDLDLGENSALRMHGVGGLRRKVGGAQAAGFDLRQAALEDVPTIERRGLAQRGAVFRSGISSGHESIALRILMGYVMPMITSFKGKFAEPILQGRTVPKGFPANLAKVARRKLVMVDSAAFLGALNAPPGNRLEALKGDLAGKHSIRINDQWRIVFKWTDAGPADVEIIDYHE